ncbi:YcxB family protein [Paenibacillus methanolicus]|uniref:YcxB-like protein n=1 Tax=Paenibacillus methanolicus TaxID=582686 RepID=A0A5S5CFZ7_9BACL|nr:YcxB family protein [Paenibacillus methanolicus]TYP78079.1 YcxB-like protein [Paenibacillus methanolicus]
MQEMQVIRVSVVLTYRDYFRLNLWHSIRSRLASLLPYFACYIGVVLYLMRDIALADSLPLIAGSAVALSVVIYGLTYGSLWLRSKRVFDSDRLLRQEMRYAFSVEGIAYEQSSGTGMLSWEDVFKVAENRDFMIVYMGPSRTVIVPKSALDGEQVAALRSLLRDAMDPARLKLAG